MLKSAGDKMHDRVDNALRQALDAREKALMAGDNRLKSEWMKVAQMWEAVAAEYREIQAVRASSRGG